MNQRVVALNLLKMNPRVVGLIFVVFAFLSFTDANFYSKLVDRREKSDDEGEKASRPAGAASNLGSNAQVGSSISFYEGAVYVKLANNNRIPLVGYGVGNLQHDLVKGMVAAALQDTKKSMLIDTSRASENEDLVAAGIVKGVEKLDKSKKTEVHVLTKVWYTHLGYERTKLSVMESLDALQPALDHEKVNLKLHVLLHWPRCYENITWMDCDREEMELPEHTREAGPNPNEDPDGAWKESWRALEDLYLSGEYPLASIGVSNFDLAEMEEMETFARVLPHVLQVDLWSLVYDARLVDYCHQHRIYLQAYNVVGSTIGGISKAPRASNHIQKVANELSQEYDDEEMVTPVQVVLAWLIQHGIGVIPTTANFAHMEENSAVSLLSVPALNDHQADVVAQAVEAYLGGEDDMEHIHVSVTFHAASKDVVLYWMGPEGNESTETRIALLRQGDTFEETTYPMHVFRAYDAQNKDIWTEHEITSNFGEHVEVQL